jgi:hypothetical protein
MVKLKSREFGDNYLSVTGYTVASSDTFKSPEKMLVQTIIFNIQNIKYFFNESTEPLYSHTYAGLENASYNVYGFHSIPSWSPLSLLSF